MQSELLDQTKAIDIQWFDIREFFSDHKRKFENILKFIELAKQCPHPDAQWFAKVFDGIHVDSFAVVENILLQTNNARGICFAALISSKYDRQTQFVKAAEMGYAFAQAICAIRYFRCFGLGIGNVEQTQKAFSWALEAACQSEREAFVALGYFYELQKDKEKERENILKAARLGCFQSMETYARYFDLWDVRRWDWWCLAASKNYGQSCLKIKLVNVIFLPTTPLPMIFRVGRVMKGHVDALRLTIFNCLTIGVEVDAAQQAIEVYDKQCKSARLAVDAWCIFALRMNNKINRDVRKKIGMLVWNCRDTTAYN
ncbi:MAG: hypothetical protein K2Q45_03880 [Nitrosomonas sp.]|nr:hypothetical protein [Nitrosomonas sp.]